MDFTTRLIAKTFDAKASKAASTAVATFRMARTAEMPMAWAGLMRPVMVEAMGAVVEAVVEIDYGLKVSN
jgi:hypothetical protein